MAPLPEHAGGGCRKDSPRVLATAMKRSSFDLPSRSRGMLFPFHFEAAIGGTLMLFAQMHNYPNRLLAIGGEFLG